MAKLYEYPTLESKKLLFEQTVINSVEEFHSEINSLYEQPNIYRGVSESKFSLYSSSQRHYIENNLNIIYPDYFDFIRSLIINARTWGNEMLVKFFQEAKLEINDIAILSFLQHYGCPTPLIDWSYSLDNSLYFASSWVSSRNTLPNSINDYFSIYIVKDYENSIYNNMYLQGSDDLVKDLEESISGMVEKMTADDKSYKDFEKFKANMYGFIDKSKRERRELDFWVKGTVGIIEDHQDSGWQRFFTNMNFNIINQEGLFIFSNLPNIPLERYIWHYMAQSQNKDEYNEESYFANTNKLLEVWHEPTVLPDMQAMGISKINSIEIHKSLKQYILRYLSERNVTREMIYPDPKEIAAYALNQSMSLSK